MSLSAQYSGGRLCACLCAAVATFALAPAARAVDWINPAGGTFGDGANWAGGVAPSGSESTFNLDDAYTVDFNNNHSVTELLLRDGDVSFDVGGHTMGVSTSFYVAPSSGEEATFQLVDGTLSSTESFIGHGSASNGTALVTGANTLWTNSSNNFYVGASGNGTLTIAEGAQVTTPSGFIGQLAGGAVTVTGAGSSWTTSGGLAVGLSGVGALTVADEGLMHVGQALSINSLSTVNVNGGTLRFNGYSRATGGTVSFTAGTIQLAGDRTMGSVDAAIGDFFGASPNIASGKGLTVEGNAGIALLTVSGGAFTSQGATSIASGGALTLDGGSITTGSFNRTVGTFNHHDGTFTVAGGAYTQASGTLSIDGNAAGALPELVLTGGATTSGIDELRVGDAQHGSLTVSGGSVLSNGANIGYLGFAPGSSGVATITGAGSSWTNGQLSVGVEGQGTLVIEDGAQVISNSGASIGPGSGTGTATVTGAGSNWTLNHQLALGSSYTGAVGSGTLNIAAGATVNAPLATVWTGGTVNVQTGGTLFVTEGLTNHGEFEIAAGGAVSAGSVANTGNLVNHGALTGNISTHFGGVLSGAGAFNGAVTVSSGGTFSPGASPGTATTDPTQWLSGGNFLWEINALSSFEGSEGSDPGWDLWHTGDLSISGPFTIKLATLTAGNVAGLLDNWDPLNDYQWRIATSDNGAFSSLSNLVIDATGFQNSLDDGSFTLSATPDGNDLFLNFSAAVDPGLHIDGGQLVVFNDGQTRAYTEVRVGVDATGELRILNQSVLENLGFASIGINVESSGVVTVSGSGSTWTNSGSLFVGGSETAPGGAGVLTVESGAFVNVDGTTKIWDGGEIVLAGGTLNTSELEFAGSTFTFTAGTLNILGTQAVDSEFLEKVLGTASTIASGKVLLLGGVATLTQPLTLDGGTLSVGELVNAPLLDFRKGALQITAADLVIGLGGAFGQSFTLGAGQDVHVVQDVEVAADGVLSIGPSGHLSAGSLHNQGHIELGGATARLAVFADFTNSGLISGGGRIEADFQNDDAGEVRVESGGTLTFTGATAENSGEVRLLGGIVHFHGDVANAPSGRITGRGALIADGGMNNQGHVALSSGISDIYGDVVNETADPAVGITVSGNADATFWGDVTNTSGLFRVAAGSSATFFGSFGGVGVSGSGDVFFEADVTPGSSPGLAAFGGNVTLGPQVELEIELGGLVGGSEYDQLGVSGDLTLDGTLRVSFIEDFAPSAGDSFDILDWGALSGAFSSVSLPALDGLLWDASQLYTSGVLSVAPIFAADFDEDGDVDGSDLTSWRRGFGESGATHARGDADADLDVDGADFLAWQRQFGSPVAAPAGENVPEPATAWLVAAMLCGTGVMRRRQH